MKAEAPVEAPLMEKKSMTHSYPAMVAEAFVELNTKDEHPHGHGIGAIKHVISLKHPDLPLGWEKRLSHAIKMMAGKRHLVHVPGHPGMFKMSKAMVEKQKRKRGPRKVKAGKVEVAAKAEEAPKKVAAKKSEKKAPVKAMSPARRAKKAA